MAKQQKQSKFIGRDRVIDEDGVVLATYARFRDGYTKTKFITMFLDDDNLYAWLNGLGNSGKVLGFILKKYDAQSGIFYFTNTTKQDMIKELGISIGTIRSSVKALHDNSTILRVIGSEYMINPHLFYKGKMEKLEEVKGVFDKVVKMNERKLIEV